MVRFDKINDKTTSNLKINYLRFQKRTVMNNIESVTVLTFRILRLNVRLHLVIIKRKVLFMLFLIMEDLTTKELYNP